MLTEKKMFLRIALPTPLRRLFDYLPPQPIDKKALIPGVRVRVPFQSRTLVGILIEVTEKSSVPAAKLKPALEILDNTPILSADVYQLCKWAAGYYHYSLGEVLASALPALLRKGNSTDVKVNMKSVLPTNHEALRLNAAQQTAVSTICAAKDLFRVILLDGVTGSGKTEVYLRAIEQMINEDKQVLVLVPEISLTPQTIDSFRQRLHLPIAALHSDLSDKKRLQAWLAARSNDIKIVIGTRSAIFTPFANLGLIIVDEEHDNSYKQQERFRYHARDLAVMRGNLSQIPVVLGSATPSLESLLNVTKERYSYVSLPSRAGRAQLPQYQLIDLQRTQQEEGLARGLLTSIHQHLEQDNQVILFLNRRGFAPVLYCTQCQWIASCQRCDARMVYHHNPMCLRCHHCDSRGALPKLCPQCASTTLQPIGLGTQRLEQTLEKHFPDVPIIRMDRDNTRRKGSMQALLDQINQCNKAILLGTQMLAKGHHFPRVTLVGIIDADSGLFSADFRAAEQMGQLLLQVAGRAGRAEKPGTVIIQTHHPDHPLLQTLLQQGYNHFSQALLAQRKQALLPPFTYFAVLRAEAYVEVHAHDFLMAIKQMCTMMVDKSVSLLGPVPPLMAKRKGMYCQHLIVKANERPVLQNFLKNLLNRLDTLPLNPAVKWGLDVDPIEV